MKIQPITFEKKYKKPRTGKREIQNIQIQPQKQRMSPEASRAELVKQADTGLREAEAIKQTANSAKIRSYEVLDKAKRNFEFADGLYAVIKEDPNSSNKNFVVRYQGTTYKVELQNTKYRAIGQSRGFAGKKDVFEFELKKGELKTSIIKGYHQEKDSNTYTSAEEYHQTRGVILDIFFDVATTKTDKKIKEGFSFYSDGSLASYVTNAKTFANDFEYGEFGARYSFDTIWNSFSNCDIGLNCSKNAFSLESLQKL